MELRDAHVLITGGSRGIGAALARDFHAAGARVTLAARSAGDLAAVAEPLGAATVVADLAEVAGRAGLVARVEDLAGPVDVLVNNAGWEAARDLLGLEPGELARLFAVNALAPAELCRQVLPGMIARGRGHVLNISSLAAAGVLPGLVPYSATKAALSHLTAGLRAELRGLPVGTTLVEVGLVGPTTMQDRVLAHEPTRLAFRRFYRLGLLADVPVDRVSREAVAAVRTGRRHVRLPRRAWLFAALPEAPRRMAEWILRGVPPRG